MERWCWQSRVGWKGFYEAVWGFGKLSRVGIGEFRQLGDFWVPKVLNNGIKEVKGMNQSFLVDELTNFFFFCVFEKNIILREVVYLMWIFLCSSLLLYCWWVPEIIRPNLSSFRHRFFPTFLGPEGLSVAGSKDEQCPSGPHLLWYPGKKERPGRSCSKELTGWHWYQPVKAS